MLYNQSQAEEYGRMCMKILSRYLAGELDKGHGIRQYARDAFHFARKHADVTEYHDARRTYRTIQAA